MLEPSVTEIRFGDVTFKSLGKLYVRISTPDSSWISIPMDVVQGDIAMLIVIDVMDRKKLIAYTVENV